MTELELGVTYENESIGLKTEKYKDIYGQLTTVSTIVTNLATGVILLLLEVIFSEPIEKLSSLLFDW